MERCGELCSLVSLPFFFSPSPFQLSSRCFVYALQLLRASPFRLSVGSAIGGHWIEHGTPGAAAIAAQRSLPMPELVAILERVLDRRGTYTVVDRVSHLPIEAPLHAVAQALGIDMGEGYAERVLRKYCGSAAANAA